MAIAPIAGRWRHFAAPVALLIPAGFLAAGAAASPVGHRPGADRGVVAAHLDHGRGHHRATPANGRGAIQLTTIFSGATLGLTQPDDVTWMGGDLFVGFQNGVGPQGEPSATGATASTVVELTGDGAVVRSWNLAGHVDGLAADPTNARLIATVNEDGNSSLFTIDPASPNAQQYMYQPSPLPHGGGTDAVAVVNGDIFISASAPTTPPSPAYPALYSALLDGTTHTATLSPVFSDTATATSANLGASSGQTTTLGLTDPDSNGIVPAVSPRFAGDLVLDSQGDDEQVYVAQPWSSAQHRSLLRLSSSVNDTAWATAASGTLYVTDHANDLVDALRGRFTPGTAYVAATPCSDNAAPASCPGPGYGANYLATLDLGTGSVRALNLGGELLEPQGLAFVAGRGGSHR